MSIASLTQLKNELERNEGRLERIRKQSKEVMRHAMCGGSAVAFGSAAGWINGRYGYAGHPAYLPGTQIPVDMAMTALGVGAYAFGLGGKYKDLALYGAVGVATQVGARYAQATGMQQQTAANAAALGQGQAAGAIAGGQYAGAIAGGQYAGAVAGGQYAGAVPGGAYG